ncbi:VG15 protein [Trueperella pyogenes]
MASTEEGRALSDEHRRAQARLGGSFRAVAPELDSLIDLGDLDGSFPDWYAGYSGLRAAGQQTSTAMATAYLGEFARVEGAGELVAGRLPQNELTAITNAHISVVRAVKARIAGGMSPEEAWRIQSAIAYGRLTQSVLDAGRAVITRADFRYSGRPGRWRRISDGQPCAFCAMLVGRGPVYSEQTADFESHDHCGCGAEPVVGEWEPTELEALWRSSYLQAAKDAANENGPKWARTAAGKGNILEKMRRNTPTLFHDGVFPKGTK